MKQQPVDRYKRVKELKKTENIVPQARMSWRERYEFTDAPEDKMEYFRENSLFEGQQNWTGEEEVICLACKSEWKIQDYRLVRERSDAGNVFITCKNCSGSLIDFKEVKEEIKKVTKVPWQTIKARERNAIADQTKLREEKQVTLIVRRKGV